MLHFQNPQFIIVAINVHMSLMHLRLKQGFTNYLIPGTCSTDGKGHATFRIVFLVIKVSDLKQHRIVFSKITVSK